MSGVVDLRSDTVTRPTPGMRAAIAAAVVGDDVFGDDPTVNALQERVAALLGKEDALFVTSGTQGNQCALMSHCARGEEAIVGALSHMNRYEGGAGAVLGGVPFHVIANRADGTLPLTEIEAAIKPDDQHFPVTRLLCLEDTWNGRVLPQDYLDAAAALAHRHGLATHLDGARLFNAVVASGVAPARLVQGFDSVSVCFSKGLGAPVGSVLVGPRDFIARARRVRKMLGGGLRQAGVLAAAALYALDHHVDRLAEDHAHARLLAEGLQGLPGVTVEPAHTNMVFLDVEHERAAGLVAQLGQRGLLCTGLYRLRLVTHLDLGRDDIERAVAVLREVLG
ncbi:low-specificity L-threonine aldolase [Piscinibacter defluvii]|uniref:low-specificity L-threonine aldolase n=1 Tax=Piscinibacter defluvii TaxID=1796922 RepID=UPI0021752438|nr:low-specificity L-threonine aldolase [Piscinibacter defluvii]